MIGYWIGLIIGAVLFGYQHERRQPTQTIGDHDPPWLDLHDPTDQPEPQTAAWTRSLLIYTPSLAFWLVIDLLARRGRAAAEG
jgi:hypothetical protein